MVVENIDFKQVYIEILMAESRNEFCRTDCPSRQRTRQIMNEAGYLRWEDVIPRSDLYIHPASPFAEMMISSSDKQATEI
jgi:hypothetical protein